MITIRHHVGPSGLVEGVGLFCDEAIRKGDVVFKYDARFVMLLSKTEIQSLPVRMKEAIDKYAYSGAGIDKTEDAVYFCADDSRFMNHSDQPNTTWVDEDGTYIAATDIEKGSELTCDYSEFCEPGAYCFGFRQAQDSSSDRG